MNGDERGEEEESRNGGRTDGHGLGAVFPIKVTHTRTEREHFSLRVDVDTYYEILY